MDNAAVSTAIKDVFEETRSILEPSGAVAVAGAKAYLKARPELTGVTVVAVTSGANMNFDRLRLVADLAGVGDRESTLAVELPEAPGAFRAFLDAALGAEGGGGGGSNGGGANGDGTNGGGTSGTAVPPVAVTEFKYRYSAGRPAAVWVGLDAAPGSPEAAAVLSRLRAGGYPALDASGLEAAQVHLRHLVGGHAAPPPGTYGDGGAASGTAAAAAAAVAAAERIFQVDFPERPGALRAFLPAVSPRWRVTLFHYRRSGDRSSGVLLGLAVPPEDAEEFAAAVAGLTAAGDYQFTEVAGRERDVFKMFIM